MVSPLNAKGRTHNEETQGGMKNGMIRNKKRRIRRNPDPVDMASILRAQASQAIATASNAQTVKLTPYAEQLLTRSGASQAGNSSLTLGGDEWIPTRVAAKLTGYSQRQIQALCDMGFFVEGKEWRKRPPAPGTERPGRLWLRHSALKKMEGES
jgi:hypothetical protein